MFLEMCYFTQMKARRYALPVRFSIPAATMTCVPVWFGLSFCQVRFVGAHTVGATHECLQEREESGAREVFRCHIAWKKQRRVTFYCSEVCFFIVYNSPWCCWTQFYFLCWHISQWNRETYQIHNLPLAIAGQWQVV